MEFGWWLDKKRFNIFLISKCSVINNNSAERLQMSFNCSAAWSGHTVRYNDKVAASSSTLAVSYVTLWISEHQTHCWLSPSSQLHNPNCLFAFIHPAHWHEWLDQVYCSFSAGFHAPHLQWYIPPSCSVTEFSNIRVNIMSFILTSYTRGPRRPSYDEFQQNPEE